MQNYFEQLGLAPGATPAEVKTAYHQKLREFPAHSHPQEFKAIRAAYEALKKGDQGQVEDFFNPRPIDASLDPELLQNLRQRATAQVAICLEELVRLTF
ncbi:MAG: J domain-containing protein [Nodosilinea sp.]